MQHTRNVDSLLLMTQVKLIDRGVQRVGSTQRVKDHILTSY